MAVPTTLVDYWTSEVNRIQTLPPDPLPVPPAPPFVATGELVDTKPALDAATKEEADANEALTKSAQAVTDARRKVDDARAKLAGIPMPADGNPLLVDMRNALVEWRDAVAAHVASESVRNDKRAARERLADRVAALTQAWTAAKAELERQKTAARKVTQWMADAAQAPLKDAKTKADALLASQDRTNAEANVKGDFPSNATAAKSLFARVRARRTLSAARSAATTARAEDARSQNQSWLESTTRASAKTAVLQRAYDDAIAALEELTHSGERLNAAAAVFRQIATRTAPPLTQAQIDELNDAAKKQDRETALAHLTARDKAQSDYFQAVVDYGNALLAEQVKTPWKSESDLLNDVAALKDKKDDLDPTKAGSTAKKLASAKAAVTAAEAALLKAWVAVVPDAAWEQLDGLERSLAQAQAVSAATPAAIRANCTAAETALAKNLDDCRTERRIEEVLSASMKQRTAEEMAERDLSPRREQAAVRFVDEV
jgi:hypothetical protein